MARSQRHLRHRDGYDVTGRTAYVLAEPSLKTEPVQRLAIVALFPQLLPVTPAANLTPPVVTGNPVVGQTLTSTFGTWTPTTPGVILRHWFRGNTQISATNSATYVLVAADRGFHVYCRATASETAGATREESNRIGPIT